MKKYIKPTLDHFNISLDKEMASGLSNWISGNELNDNSITTCEFSYLQES